MGAQVRRRRMGYARHGTDETGRAAVGLCRVRRPLMPFVSMTRRERTHTAAVAIGRPSVVRIAHAEVGRCGIGWLSRRRNLTKSRPPRWRRDRPRDRGRQSGLTTEALAAAGGRRRLVACPESRRRGGVKEK
jgi:hypothetical protein